MTDNREKLEKACSITAKVVGELSLILSLSVHRGLTRDHINRWISHLRKAADQLEEIIK